MTDWRDGGHHAPLTDGLTFWRREGDVSGIPIVLIHGATVPSWEFDFLVPPLHRAGFQTLRFDLYGHGASARPEGNYSFDRFARQVEEIIVASGFPRPAFLLGHSFGAALAAATAAAQPAWVSRLVLVAPMLDFNASSRWTTLFRMPWLGDIAFRHLGLPALIRRRRRRYAGIGQPHLTERFLEQVTMAGFERSLLSMIRTAALGHQGARYSALRDFGRPVLVITGDHDAIIPPAHIARLRALLPGHAYRAIPAEHNLLITHPDDVVATLAQWLATAPSH